MSVVFRLLGLSGLGLAGHVTRKVQKIKKRNVRNVIKCQVGNIAR